MECLLPYLCMVTVPHIMVGLERMLDYRGVGLARFHCSKVFHDSSSNTYRRTLVTTSVIVLFAPRNSPVCGSMGGLPTTPDLIQDATSTPCVYGV